MAREHRPDARRGRPRGPARTRQRLRGALRAAAGTLALALALGPGLEAAATDREIAAGGRADLAHAPRKLASNGAIVLMPEIARLDCRDMTEVLALLDRSGYRGPEPLQAGHPDREIFAYEHRLASAYFRDCILDGHWLDDPGAAFSQGFASP
ncbi:MAG TPA: hypothetical protein VMM59_11405 [Thermohalobaculum sp.]|nr:hypothetical protein [Thermohalobaculum sp.]